MVYGYARVSTQEQDNRLQVDALKAAGAATIVQEKRSGTKERPHLAKLLTKLKRGDVLLVWKIDRLARSLIDFLRILSQVTAKGATLTSLTQPIDTATPAGRMMLQILGAFAEFEREIIRERTIAGLRAAHARGARSGRPRALTSEQENRVFDQWKTGKYTFAELAKNANASPSVVKRAVYRRTKPDSSSLV